MGRYRQIPSRQAVPVGDADPDGDPLGDPLGLPLGDPDGEPLGLPLGEPDGDPLGLPLGDPDGEPLGLVLGDAFALLCPARGLSRPVPRPRSCRYCPPGLTRRPARTGPETAAWRASRLPTATRWAPGWWRARSAARQRRAARRVQCRSPRPRPRRAPRRAAAAAVAGRRAAQRRYSWRMSCATARPTRRRRSRFPGQPARWLRGRPRSGRALGRPRIRPRLQRSCLQRRRRPGWPGHRRARRRTPARSPACTGPRLRRPIQSDRRGPTGPCARAPARRAARRPARRPRPRR